MAGDSLTGGIVGGAVGCVVLISLVFLFVAFRRRKRVSAFLEGFGGSASLRVSARIVASALSLLVLMSLLYYTVFRNPYSRLSTLEIAVVDSDAVPLLGPLVVGALNSTSLYSWRFLPPTTTVESLRNDVERDRVWAAIVIPQNFSRVFLDHYQGRVPRDTPYANHVTVLLDQAKQYGTAVATETAVQELMHAVDAKVRAAMMTSKAFPARSPGATIGCQVAPVSAAVTALHHVGAYGYFVATYVPLLAQWLGTLVLSNFTLIAYHSKTTAKGVRVPLYKVVLCKLGVLFLLQSWLALMVTAALSWYGVPMSEGFGVVWIVFWLTGLAFSGLVTAMMSALGSIGILPTVLVLIFQVVTCDGIFTRASYPEAFKFLAPVLPMFHGVHLLRYAFWSTMPVSRTYHILILLTWHVLGTAASVLLWTLSAAKRSTRFLCPMRFQGLRSLSKVF